MVSILLEDRWWFCFFFLPFDVSFPGWGSETYSSVCSDLTSQSGLSPVMAVSLRSVWTPPGLA